MADVYVIVENGVVTERVLSESALADNWFLENDAQVGWLYDGVAFMPPAEPTPTSEEVRRQRNRLLAESDWVTLKAVDELNDGFGIQLPQVWVDYRQALRDVPQQPGFPGNVTWPAKPE